MAGSGHIASSVAPGLLVTSRAVNHCARLLLALLFGWLIASAVWVHMDLDDGYATIVNSQHFLGITQGYFWQRGPFVAWLLVPAEWTANWLRLTPFEVWPHHATMAILHAGYLVATWKLLALNLGSRLSTLAGFLAAVPSVVFFGYAPFISHDIFPGLIALLMVVLANRHLNHPRPTTLAALVGLGLAAMLIKQTFVIFWAAIGLSAVLAAAFAPHRDQISKVAIAQFALGSVISGIAAWLVYCWVLRNSFADTAFLLGPVAQYRGVFENVMRGGPLELSFDPLLYVKNLGAFGLLAMTLAVPGAIICLRSGNSFLWLLAVCWLLLLTAMQIIKVKEVRYLAFLAPLTAFLVAAAIDAITRHRRIYALPMVGLLLIDTAAAAREALRIDASYYRTEVLDFLNALPAASPAVRSVVITGPLSFIAPEGNAFRGDRFHRITHVVADQVRLLGGYQSTPVLEIPDHRAIDAPHVQPGSVVIFTSDPLTRRHPFRPDNLPGGIESYAQMVTVAEPVTLLREGDFYRLSPSGSSAVVLLPDQLGAGGFKVVRDLLSARDVSQLRNIRGEPDMVQQLGFRVLATCDLAGCRRTN